MTARYVYDDIGVGPDAMEAIASVVGCEAVTFRTWLPGDFDARDLHRRSGWALWRYRGEHRRGQFTADELRSAVADAAEGTRRAHLRSLRRPFQPIVYLGERRTELRWYGVVGDHPEELQQATLVIHPDVAPVTIPAIAGPPAQSCYIDIDDDTPTDPLLSEAIWRSYADPIETPPPVAYTVADIYAMHSASQLCAGGCGTIGVPHRSLFPFFGGLLCIDCAVRRSTPD